MPRLRQKFVDWLLRDLHLHNCHFGDKTITLSPAGGGDVIRWSAPAAPLAPYDLGMAATGRLRAWVASAARDIATTPETHGGMYAYDKAISLGITTSNYYYAFRAVAGGDVLVGTCNDWTFNAGRSVDADVTNEINNGGLLQIECSAAHNLTTNDTVVVTNANNAAHNNATMVTVDTATKFTCQNIPYVAGAGASAARVDEPAYLQAGTYSAGIYIMSFTISGTTAVANKVFKFELNNKNTPLDNIVVEENFAANIKSVGVVGISTVAIGDRIWLSCKETVGSTNFTVNHMNLHVSKV